MIMDMITAEGASNTLNLLKARADTVRFLQFPHSSILELLFKTYQATFPIIILNLIHETLENIHAR
jgi:hypothetical protein